MTDLFKDCPEESQQRLQQVQALMQNINGFQKCQVDGCSTTVRFPLVAPRCAHILCEAHVNVSLLGWACSVCGAMCDLNAFQKLQPMVTQDAWVHIDRWLDNHTPKVAFVLEKLKRPEFATAKVIIYSRFLEHIEIICHHLNANGIGHVRLHAGVRADSRAGQLLRFRDEEGVRALVMSDQGAHGLDLSFASLVFIMEPIWEEGKETQVIGRAHRMGATGTVHVFKLYMLDTVEQKLIEWRAGLSNHKAAAALQRDEREAFENSKVRAMLLACNPITPQLRPSDDLRHHCPLVPNTKRPIRNTNPDNNADEDLMDEDYSSAGPQSGKVESSSESSVLTKRPASVRFADETDNKRARLVVNTESEVPA
eukprot:c20199_g1_i1.p1 GENE.c20199_g1_i1~~c20199_g1_i1.p1  ORF type:complete len:403 (-),score=95.31 c20199_g1_i1:1189-2289(-)